MNQLKAGAVLSYVIIAINAIVGIAYTPYMLRVLGQAEYGLYSLAASVIAYLTVLDLGFGNAIVRYTAKFRAEGKLEEQYNLFGMFLRLFIAIGAVALIVGLALTFNVDNLFGNTMGDSELEKLRVMMALMAFNLAFTFPLSIYGAIITAYERFIFLKAVNIVRILLNPLVMVLMLSLGYRAVAMVVVTTIFNIVTLLINGWYCHRKLKIKFRFKRFEFAFLKEVSIYSFWIFLNAIMDQIYWGAGQFLLGMFRGAEVVAIYAVALQLKNMYFMFSTAISGVLLPKVTGMVARSASDSEVSDLFIRTGRLQFIVMGFITAGFVVLGRPFIDLWAGDGYSEAYYITLLFFLSTFTPLIQNVAISILQARNELKFRSLLYFFISVASLVVAIPLTVEYGSMGMAACTAAALVLGQGIIINVYYGRKIGLNISRFWVEILRMAIVPLVIVGACLLLRVDSYVHSVSDFLVAGLIFGAIYVPMFWFFSMNRSERQLLSKPILKIFR